MSVEVSISFDYVSDTPSRTRRRQTDPPVNLARTVWTRTITVANDTRNATDSLSVQGSADIRLTSRAIRVIPRIEFDGLRRSAQPSDAVAPSEAVMIPVETGAVPLMPLNLGSDLRFGQPADMAVILASQRESPRLRVYRMSRSGTDSVLVEDLALQVVGRLARVDGPRLEHVDGSGSGPVLYRTSLASAAYGNLTHRAYVVEDGNVLGRLEFLPRWYGIPVGLLDIDVAIDLMRYIVKREELRAFRRGTPVEREARFRQWWDERDPTPDTAYNELMAEYFSRIDQAYASFTTPSRSGLESDMGRIWIQNGKPMSVDRRFPPGGGTIEVWEYANRRYIFRATSGFGDFELVSPH